MIPPRFRTKPAAGLNAGSCTASSNDLHLGRCVIGGHRPGIWKVVVALVVLTRRNVALLKRLLIAEFPALGSGHADEALAAGFGFNTHAALLAALKAQGMGSKPVIVLSEAKLAERAGQLAGLEPAPDEIARVFGGAELPDDNGLLWTEITKLRKRSAANEN
jgi:hypothetical protein